MAETLRMTKKQLNSINTISPRTSKWTGCEMWSFQLLFFLSLPTLWLGFPCSSQLLVFLVTFFCARDCSASSLSQDACIIASSSSWYVHHSKPLQFNVCPVGWLVVQSVGRMDGWLLNNCACAHTKKTYDASSSWLLLVTVCKNSEEGKDYGSQKVTFCLVIRTLKCTHSVEFLLKEKKYVWTANASTKKPKYIRSYT